MPTPISDLSPAALRAICVVQTSGTASPAARQFAWARMLAERGQRMNHIALAHLHTKFTRPPVAAILAARMLSGTPEWGGAA